MQIRELVPESQAYMDLLAFERKLDQTIMRKRVDIQEALKRPMKVRAEKGSLQGASALLSAPASFCRFYAVAVFVLSHHNNTPPTRPPQ